MITPEQIAKSGTEHAHQAALFCWAANMANDPTTPVRAATALRLLFAIPNGDQRGDGSHKGAQIAGARLKAEGMKSGVPDVLLPWPSSGCNGLFIEMKKPGLQTKKNGGCSDEQVNYIWSLRLAGYDVRICYSWIEAKNAVISYIQI